MDDNLQTSESQKPKALELVQDAVVGFNRLTAKHAEQIAHLEAELAAERKANADIILILGQLTAELNTLAPAPAVLDESDAKASHLDADGLPTTFGGQTWQQ
jgi:hypothetical protein